MLLAWSHMRLPCYWKSLRFTSFTLNSPTKTLEQSPFIFIFLHFVGLIHRVYKVNQQMHTAGSGTLSHAVSIPLSEHTCWSAPLYFPSMSRDCVESPSPPSHSWAMTLRFVLYIYPEGTSCCRISGANSGVRVVKRWFRKVIAQSTSACSESNRHFLW